MSHLLHATYRGADLSELWLQVENPSEAGSYDNAAGCAARLADLLTAAMPHGPRRLWVGTATEHRVSYEPVVEVLLRMRPPVEFLALGDFVYPGRSLSEAWFRDDFWPMLGTLRELVVQVDDVWMRNIRSASLTRLAIRSRALDPRVVAEVGAAELPALDQLELWIGDYAYQWDGTVADLGPLLAADGLPALQHFRCCADIADELVEALCGSPLLGRLRTLDLSAGGLTDRGARTIAANRTAFAHLVRLNVDGNVLSDAGRALVADVAETVYVGRQRPDTNSLTQPRPAPLG